MASIEPTDQQVDELLEQHPGGLTYEQIAGVLGVSKQRVSQIVDEAVAKAAKFARWRRLNSANALPDQFAAHDWLAD